MTRRILRLSLCLPLAAAMLGGVPAQDQNIPGQKAFPLIQDTFKFVPGSWADYTLFDKAKNETFRMRIAALEKETVKGVPCSWLEIEVEMKDAPLVVTSFLAEETPNGPGRIEKAVVQVAGMSPFSVPKKYLDGPDAQVADFKPAKIVKKLEAKKVVLAGKTIEVLFVEAETEKNETVSAGISLRIPPIAVYQAETSEIKMTLNDWGGEARTRITGPAIPFFLWILEAGANALIKK